MLKKRVQYLLLVLALTLIGTSDIAAQNEDESPSRATEQIHLPFTIRFDGGLGFLNKPKAMNNAAIICFVFFILSLTLK